jgi:NPCBM/NEW2 domain
MTAPDGDRRGWFGRWWHSQGEAVKGAYIVGAFVLLAAVILAPVLSRSLASGNETPSQAQSLGAAPPSGLDPAPQPAPAVVDSAGGGDSSPTPVESTPGGSAPLPTPAYLDEMTNLGHVVGGGLADINGVPHPHSVAAGFCFGETNVTAEYSLERSYRVFRATIGLLDTSNTKEVVKYDVKADGRTVYEKTVRFGQSFDVDVPVTGVLRLALTTSLLSQQGMCDGAAEWGEARAEAA